MNIVPSPAQVQPSSRPNPEVGAYSTQPRRPGNGIDVVDAEVVSEDKQPRSLRVRLPEDFDLHGIIGTAVATVSLGFALLLVALAAALVLTEIFVLMITEPL